MPQEKPQRLFSVATYNKRIAAAKEKGRELVAKRSRLIASRNRVNKIIELTEKRADLVKAGKKAALKKFDDQNGAYLGSSPRPLKEVKSLQSKLVSRINNTRKSITNLRARLTRLNDERAQRKRRNEARKAK